MGYSTKTSSDQLINLYVLQDACHEIIILNLWRFLHIRDTGRRGDKITVHVDCNLKDALKTKA